jgi:hypothetical protein
MNIVDVRSYAELRGALRPFGESIMLRGQSELYDGRVVPSLSRAASINPEEGQYFNDLWHDVLGAAVSSGDFSLLESRFVHNSDDPDSGPALGIGSAEQGALLQHYGERSRFVDVTASLDVALWFAHHAWVGRRIGWPKDGKRQTVLCASYAPRSAGTGYVFAMAPRLTRNRSLGLRHGDLVKLHDVQLAGRMRAQRAALIYCDIGPAAGDLADYVVAVFRFSVPLLGFAAANWPTTRLFPPPHRDPVLRLLLRSSPFVAPLPRSRAISRLAEIPEYYDWGRIEGSAEWRSYRRHDRIVAWPFFHYALRTARGEDKRPLRRFDPFIASTSVGIRDVRRALPILNSSSSHAMLVRRPEKDIRLPPRATSIFLEYGPLQEIHAKTMMLLPVAHPDGEWAEIRFYFVDVPQVRGVWVIQDRSRLYARLYGGHPRSGLLITPGSWFRWDGDELVVDETEAADVAENERIALWHAIGFLQGGSPANYRRPRGLGYILYHRSLTEISGG